MDNSLKIGQYILEVLKDNEELMSLLGEGKIWPITARQDTLLPYITYTRDASNIEYTKITGHDNTIIFTYRVFSEDYDEGLNIVNLLRNILERRTINFPNEIKINDIKVQNVYESFADDVFIQVITFSAMVE